MHILHGGPAGVTYALYGAREAALHTPLQLADEAARRIFLTPYFQTASTRENIRLALIAQGVFAATDSAALWDQADQALHSGMLRIAPVPVSGLLPVKTEPAQATLSGKPFIMPPRLNPRPTPPPPAPEYKLTVEIAGRREGRSLLDLRCRPVDRSTPRKHLSGFDSGNDAHRTQLEVHGLNAIPHLLTLGVPLMGGGVMELPLGTAHTPVEKSVQRACWDTVLVPLVPFIYSDPQHNRAHAAPTPQGWLAMFVNGHLHREWWSSGQGSFRDVDLGAREGVGDQRVARGQPQDHLLAPHLLNGQPQKVELLYSRQPLSWATLMKLGGLAPDDPRFSAEEKQRAANIAVDAHLRSQLLVTLDLSGHAEGFNVDTGAIGPVVQAPVWSPDPLRGLRGSGMAVAYLAPVFRKKQVLVWIFEHGIFGARLWNPAGDKKDTRFVWDPNDVGGIVSAYAKSKLSAFMARDWSDDEIKLKAERLHNPQAQVMTGHEPQIKKEVLKELKTTRAYQETLRQAGPDADSEAVAESVYQRRSARGWYGVLKEYIPMFEAIEALEDEDYIHVVYAVGADWRNDLTQVGEHLKREIERILKITEYPELGTKGVHYETGLQKVMLVTHSQGGLDGRYASEVAGGRDLILGVIHLNQPTTGAPVLARRFRGGSGVERGEMSFFAFPDKIFGEILGTSRYHFTKMAGTMAGALCLLPGTGYVQRPGAKPADWLHCPPRSFKPDAIANAYSDLYPHDRVGLLGHTRYAIDGKPKPYTAQEFMKVRFTKKISAAVQQSLSKMSGMMKEFMTGQATMWRDGPVHDFKPGEIPDDATYYLPEETPWHHDNVRLRPHAGMSQKQRKIAEKSYEKITEALAQAEAFETALRNPDGSLKLHPNTYIISSTGLPTVTQVRMVLNKDKNGDAVLECPYERTPDGDGTVPLSSQDALLAYGAKRAGPVITQGNVVHADICTHPQAIQQIKDAMAELVAPLRPKDQENLFAPSSTTAPGRNT